MKLAELENNNVFAFGQYAGEVLHWRKVDDDVCIMQNAEAIGGVRYDSHEPRSANKERQAYGNACYIDSNVRQFLNSNKADWFIPQHEADYCTESFKQAPGFLCEFTQEEISSIIPMEYTSYIPEGSRKKYGQYVVLKDLVVLPSMSQLFSGKWCPEGEYIPWLLDANTKTYTRSYIASATHRVYGAYNGGITERYANNIFCITPIIHLNPECEIVVRNGEVILEVSKGRVFDANEFVNFLI